jgi:hypothetical protein
MLIWYGKTEQDEKEQHTGFSIGAGDVGACGQVSVWLETICENVVSGEVLGGPFGRRAWF